jgi:hypothetical protein
VPSVELALEFGHQQGGHTRIVSKRYPGFGRQRMVHGDRRTVAFSLPFALGRSRPCPSFRFPSVTQPPVVSRHLKSHSVRGMLSRQGSTLHYLGAPTTRSVRATCFISSHECWSGAKTDYLNIPLRPLGPVYDV